MQTFGIFTAVGILGGRRGAIAVLVYILMGLIGLPVFSGFRGGPAALLGTTGGYILGFLFTALLMWAAESLFGKRPMVFILSMAAGLIACYAFGTLWFMYIYMKTEEPVGLGAVLGWCVIPFIIPDMVKMGLAFIVSRRVGTYLRPQIESRKI